MVSLIGGAHVVVSGIPFLPVAVARLVSIIGKIHNASVARRGASMKIGTAD